MKASVIIPTLEYEQKLWSSGNKYVAGVDEVGRGALAGPVVAAAVIFEPTHTPIDGVRDSKTLSQLKKQTLNSALQKSCSHYAIGQASVNEIDELGIVAATALAMKRALQEIGDVNHVLIDGKPFTTVDTLSEYRTTYIVKGDSRSYSIAAASIIAKVFRDTLMISHHEAYPHYHFNSHVGYGTSKHRQMIEQYGVSDFHRKTFCRRWL